MTGQTDEDIDRFFHGTDVPRHIRGSLWRWATQGIPPGSFLQAVLRNDLRAACERADEINRVRLYDIVAWLYNSAPAECWGSPDKVEAWLSRHQPAAVDGDGK